MATNVFKHTDSGIPQLTGEVGSLIAILDWCLVTNGSWTKSWSGTNKAAYRNGTEAFYQVIDDGTEGSSARYASFRGYLDMTDVDTGTDPFPRTDLRAVSSWNKSTLANSTARAWVLVENDGMVYFSSRPAGLSTTDAAFYYFGKFHSYKAGDIGNHICMTSYTNTTAGSYTLITTTAINATVSPILTAAYPWIALDQSNIGESITFSLADKINTGNATVNITGLSYPDPETGAFYIIDGFYITHQKYGTGNVTANATLRGELRGLSRSIHKLTVAEGWTGELGDTFFNDDGSIEYIVMEHAATGTINYIFVQLEDIWV